MMSAKVRARELAREAKARRDESRITQEKKILEATEAFYVADAEADAAQAAVAAAEADRAAAVDTLMELKEPVDSVATLCGISAREVRALRKAHRSKDVASERTSPDPVVGGGNGDPGGSS